VAFQDDAFQDDAFQILVEGIGGAGAATFAMCVESGARVTFEWDTDVQPAWSGKETRRALLGKPRQRYEFSTLLSDAQHRKILSTLVGTTAAAPLFLLALAHEDLTVASSTAGSITVHSLALCDWAVPGQRIAVVSPAGVVGEAVVQAAVGAAIGVDADLTAVAVAGARVMPAMGVYLEPEQAIGRRRVGMGRWDLAARADRFGFGASSSVGAGATVATYDSLPVWDFGIAHDFASQPLYTGAAIVDLGAKISTFASFTAVNWGRAIRIESSAQADWQWFKLFLDTVRGSHVAFLLPTGRPDLVAIGDASSGTLTVEGPPVDNAPDYAGDWFASLAHRRLRIVFDDGTYAYRTVSACAAGTGEQELTLDSPAAGAIERVEFLELCRLASDSVSVTWKGYSFASELDAVVVQQ
jgi:hypothetical protein